MLDIQHGVYAACVNDEMTAEEFVCQFETNYLKKSELEKLLRSAELVIKHDVFNGKDDKF